MTIGGAVTLGIGAAGTVGGIAVLASPDTGADSSGSAALAAGAVVFGGAAVTGGVIMGVGLKRRKEVRAVEGEAALLPSFALSRHGAALGLRGWF